jgi:hypothetical protein
MNSEKNEIASQGFETTIIYLGLIELIDYKLKHETKAYFRIMTLENIF